MRNLRHPCTAAPPVVYHSPFNGNQLPTANITPHCTWQKKSRVARDRK